MKIKFPVLGLTAVILFSLASVFLSGCKASPADKPSPFLGPEQKLHPDRFCRCYHKVWLDPSIKDEEWNKYKKVYFPEVNTNYLQEMTWWENVNLNINRKEACRKLADYMRSEFIKAHSANPTRRLIVVNKPDKETLICEIAITELVPTKVWLNAAGYYFLYSGVDQGTIAMEGRLRDGGNNKIVCKFMDREKGRVSLVSARDLTWYSHAEKIIQDWAKQSVDVVNADDNQVVEDTLPFTLMPW